jgi:N-methylhydantoinase A
MPNPYSLFCERPTLPIPRERVFPIKERMSASGATIQAPRKLTSPPHWKPLAAPDARASSVLLHAWRELRHENLVAAMIIRLDPGMIVFHGRRSGPSSASMSAPRQPS